MFSCTLILSDADGSRTEYLYWAKSVKTEKQLMNSPRKGRTASLQAPSVGRRGKISDHTPRDEVWANQKAPSSPRDPAAANQEGRPYRCTQGAPCCCSQSPVSVGHGWRCRFHCPPSLSVGILVTDVEKKTKETLVVLQQSCDLPAV